MAQLTYLDVAKATGNDLAIGLIEELNTFAPEIRTLPVRPIVGTTFKTFKRTALPSGAFRGANAGATPTKSTYEQILAQAYYYDLPLRIDKAVVDADPMQLPSLQSMEASGAMMGAGIDIGSQFYYGTTADSNGFAGLRANISSDVEVSATGTGGSGSTSVYLVWEDVQGAHLVAGNGKTIDLVLPEWQLQQTQDPNDSTKVLMQYCNNVSGYLGLAFGHKYSAGRVKLVTSAKPFTDALGAELLSKFPLFIRNSGRLRFYMNRQAAFWLQNSRSSTQTSPATGGGNINYAPTPTECQGIPITVTDSVATGSTIEQS